MQDKVLLVGPFPPPHGGVSVHVATARESMLRSGIRCAVLNIDPRATKSGQYIKLNGIFDFVWHVARHAWDQWTFHVHTNGHNVRSWLVALLGGAAGQFGAGCRLTLHSGLLPGYLSSASASIRALARLACLMCDRVVCVSREIAESIQALGVSPNAIEVTPAFLPVHLERRSLPADVERWTRTRSHLIATALFFRQEYGFELLKEAVGRLRADYPRIGCVVMGGGEGRAQAERAVTADGLREAFFFTGDVDHQTCLAVMSRSSAFVRPTYRDGDSISVREALALGLPVVASNVGTRPPEVLLFQPGDVDGLVAGVSKAIEGRSGRLHVVPELRILSNNPVKGIEICRS